jgi:hypothetical protein
MVKANLDWCAYFHTDARVSIHKDVLQLRCPSPHQKNTPGLRAKVPLIAKHTCQQSSGDNLTSNK